MQKDDTLFLCNTLLSTHREGGSSRFYKQSSSSYDSYWFIQIIQLVLLQVDMAGSNTWRAPS